MCLNFETKISLVLIGGYALNWGKLSKNQGKVEVVSKKDESFQWTPWKYQRNNWLRRKPQEICFILYSWFQKLNSGSCSHLQENGSQGLNLDWSVIYTVSLTECMIWSKMWFKSFSWLRFRAYGAIRPLDL